MNLDDTVTGFGGERLRFVTPSRLTAVETVFAMTVHKSQGSEFEHTALALPPDIVRSPPRSTVTPLVVPPKASISTPPDETITPFAAPEPTYWLPRTVVLAAVPLDIVWIPPALTVVPEA